MDISCREQREYLLSVRLSQVEADILTTLLYQATNDIVLNPEQLAIANSIMGALCRGGVDVSVHGNDQA